MREPLSTLPPHFPARLPDCPYPGTSQQNSLSLAVRAYHLAGGLLHRRDRRTKTARRLAGMKEEMPAPRRPLRRPPPAPGRPS